MKSKGVTLYIFMGIVTALMLFFIPRGLVYSLSFILFTAVLGMFLVFVFEPEKSSALLKVFFAAFTFRLILCVVFGLVSLKKRGHPFLLGADDYGYSLNALSIVEFWEKTGLIPQPGSLEWMPFAGDLTYTYWLTYLYFFLDKFLFLPLVINSCLGSLSVLFIYFFTKQLYGYKPAISSAVLFSFWPSMVMWSTQNLKEPLTVLLIIAVLWSIVMIQKKPDRWVFWIVLLLSVFITYQIRKSIAIVLSLTAVFILVPSFLKKRYIFAVIAVIFLSWGAAIGFLTKYMGFPSYSFFNALNQAHAVRTYAAETAFLVNVDISNVKNFFLYLPQFMSYILFAPFPWQTFKPSHLLSAFEMLIWLPLFLFALRGLIVTIEYKGKESLSLLVFLIIMLVSFIGEGNVGTLFRHRALIWPCWFILVSAGFFFKTEHLRFARTLS